MSLDTETTTVSGLAPLLSIEDLAAYLGVPVTTISDWRVDGKGPCGVRVGRHVKFTVSDVLAWRIDRGVGRVESDERTRLTVPVRASVRCRRRPRGARR
ncbi:MAG: helix-turn-helix domain-containing protein [Jiangellaceae bacterium]